MQAVIVGAGLAGLYTSIALARRGHRVMVVDRDQGPSEDGSWERKGVMQFHHPHGFRAQAVDALRAEMPDVVDAIITAGAEAITRPELPDRILGLRCRRLTFERVLRSVAENQHGLEFVAGHAEEVTVENGCATGVRVDRRPIDGDVILDASGRAGRLGRRHRGQPEGGECGIAYVSRQYRLLPGATAGPVNSPVGFQATYSGYQVIVFLHDSQTLSALIARSSGDRELAELRDPLAFDAACGAIPGLAAWTHFERTEPITRVLPGGRLYNSYLGQCNESGEVAVSGLIFVGDAVCTTNPTAGRGGALSLMQAQTVVQLLDQHGRDFVSASLAFDTWCRDHIKPWFVDHVRWDDHLARRWSGEDVDLSGRLPSDLIVAAAEVAPDMMRVVGPYLGMEALPDTLQAVEPQAREIYAAGWRPPVPEGPTRDELAGLISDARRAAA
jgi:flavin-dependent dehydrogenase